MTAFVFLLIVLLTLGCSVQATPPVVNTTWLKQALNSGATRVLDAAFASSKADLATFRSAFNARQSYGRFRERQSSETNANYTSSHVPGAVHFDLDIAQYPEKTERYALYPPQLFQKYVRLLGVNKGDHITVVGRGKMAGMLYASRVWWLFKVYGHERVSVLDGGLEAWTAAGYPVDNKPVNPKEGDWRAGPIDRSRIIKFEEIDWNKTEKVNLLDARKRTMFEGKEPLELHTSKPVTGSHVKGSKSSPADELVENGRILSPERLRQHFTAIGFDPSKPTIIICNTGTQAAMLTLGLAHADYDKNIKLYNGALTQVALIAPELISEK